MAASSAASRAAGKAFSGAAVQLTITTGSPQHHRPRLRLIRVASPVAEAESTSVDSQQAKQELLTWISGTKRGSNASKQLRGQVEEAQVAVEACAPAELDYSLLEGKWLLEYTTAADVVSLVPEAGQQQQGTGEQHSKSPITKATLGVAKTGEGR